MSLDKAAVVEWNNVSVDVTNFIIEYLGPNGKLIGLAQVPVKLVVGEIFVIGNPTILFISSPLDRLTLSPTSVSIASGTSTTLTLTGHFSDGSTLELNSAASWTSSSAAVATVEAGGNGGDGETQGGNGGNGGDALVGIGSTGSATGGAGGSGGLPNGSGGLAGGAGIGAIP